MKRRKFITLLGGAAVAWPLAARAQQAGKPSTIGFLGVSTSAQGQPVIDPFAQRLRELGWTEGRTVNIVYRWAEGRTERLAEIAAEFVRLRVDIIFTIAAPSALAAKRATSVIPIVFVGNNPVGVGLVASLSHPGGNVTGLSNQGTDLAGKRLLREVIPDLRRLAILANVASPHSVLEMGEVQAAARTLGLAVVPAEIRQGADITPAFEAIRGRAEALYVVLEPVVNANRVRVNTLALAARLPTMHGYGEFVQGGGLISYAPNYPSLYRRAAEFVDKILRGAKPADLPVEQPTKFDLVINLTTAKALGLEVPPTLLVRADEVIE